MAHKKNINILKTQPFWMWVAFFVLCALSVYDNNKRRANNDILDKKIANLEKEITKTQDLYVADVPQQLKPTQLRYINATNALTAKSDTLELCILQNDSLITQAFDDYAVRIGKDFQISKFLSLSDINILQNQIIKLDTMSIVHKTARNRILNNTGSLNDLSYFFETMNFDSLNSVLGNKLVWTFHTDSTNSNDSLAICSLGFENQFIDVALKTEQRLLNQAWHQKFYTHDSINTQIQHTQDIYYVPDFNIPEFHAIQTQYLHNDSIINSCANLQQDIANAEDTFEQYRNIICLQRDSLIHKRNEK